MDSGGSHVIVFWHLLYIVIVFALVHSEFLPGIEDFLLWLRRCIFCLLMFCSSHSSPPTLAECKQCVDSCLKV